MSEERVLSAGDMRGLIRGVFQQIESPLLPHLTMSQQLLFLQIVQIYAQDGALRITEEGLQHLNSEVAALERNVFGEDGKKEGKWALTWI